MENKLDNKTVFAIVTGTVLLIITNVFMWNMPFIQNDWAIRICAVVLTFLAAIFGTLTGVLIPIAACVFTGVVLSHPEAIMEMFILLVTGLATGHYAAKLGIMHGRFTKWHMLDFAILEIGVAIAAWLCVYPLLSLYAYGQDLRLTIDRGLLECFISVAAKLVICLPFLIIANHFFRKKQMVEDAKREYLYHAGK